MKRNIFPLFLVVMLSSLVLFSCKKTVTNSEKLLYLKVVNNDTIRGFWGIQPEDIIPLPDNSFWLHYTIKSIPAFKERYEHYDENYRLINSVVIDNYRFYKFVVNGNNDIVTTAMYQNPDKSVEYRFLKLDNNFHILEKNNAPEIMQAFNPLKDKSYKSYITRLSNGKYIFGFWTAQGFGITDSANAILASYDDPVKSGIPNWVNKNFYYDPAAGIRKSIILDLASDKKDNFYLLCGNNSLWENYYMVLRKHNADGVLIWQKKISNTDFGNDINYRINVIGDKIIISSVSKKVYIFNENGNLTVKVSPYQISKYFVPTLRGDGYISITSESSKIGRYVSLLKFDNDFNLIKSKQYGNQGTDWLTGFARLANGKILVSGLVETPNLKDVDLMQFKVDDNLELVK